MRTMDELHEISQNIIDEFKKVLHVEYEKKIKSMQEYTYIVSIVIEALLFSVVSVTLQEIGIKSANFSYDLINNRTINLLKNNKKDKI